MPKDQKILNFTLLNIIEKTQQVLEAVNEKPEAQKELQEIKEKLNYSLLDIFPIF